jgi:ribulose-5-phosphate 4-epimerase/fuculose-1-phosphate aldolase
VSAENKIIQLPVIKKAQAGSPELVSYIVETMRGIPPTLRVLVLEAHGLLGFGETLSMAYDVTELAEETARVAAIAEGLGGSSYMTARVGGG